MRRTILYYPSIEIPDSEWIRNAILYWDEVSSIVPYEMENELYKSSHIISILKDENVFRPIYPDNLMSSTYYNDFESECINRMKYNINQKNIPPFSVSSLQKSKLHKEKIHSSKVQKTRIDDLSVDNKHIIHKDKTSSSILDFLYENQLVTKVDNWFLIDKKLADTYMSTLAKYSALSDVNYTVIGSDKIKETNSVYPHSYRYINNNKSKSPVLNLSMSCLPSPNPDISIEKIIKFKNRYRDELLDFRRIINGFEEQLSCIESDRDLKEKSVLFRENLTRSLRDTTKMLKGARIDYFLSSLKSVINIKSPTAIATYAGLIGQEFTRIPPSVILSGIGLAGLVDVSHSYISMNKSTREKLSDKGFLYLYYAKKKKIINDFINT